LHKDNPETGALQIGVKKSPKPARIWRLSAPVHQARFGASSLGVLGRTRMHYERAMTRCGLRWRKLFSEALSKPEDFLTGTGEVRK